MINLGMKYPIFPKNLVEFELWFRNGFQVGFAPMQNSKGNLDKYSFVIKLLNMKLEVADGLLSN